MIVRELDTGIIIKVPNIQNDEEFLSKNKTGNFFKVDSLPPSSSQQWIRENGTIVSNKIADDLIESEMYKNARKAEYPDIFDYIDGLVKNDQSQIDAYLNKCREIKAKYPKEII